MKKLLVTLAVAATLGGCSPEDADNARYQESLNLSGTVVDPYVTGAIVFADYNQDDILDPTEPWALTDVDGRFGGDYCQLENSNYCLRLKTNTPTLIKAVGGYDTVTLKRLETRMATWFDGSEPELMITPLSSLPDLAIDAESSDKSFDFMPGLMADEESTRLFKLAFKLHTMVEMISQHFEDEHYPEIGEEAELPADIAGIVYTAINDQGLATQQSISDILAQEPVAMSAFLISVYDAIHAQVITAYQDAEILFATASIQSISQGKQNDFAEMAALINAANRSIDTLIDDSTIDAGVTDDIVQGALKAAAAVTALVPEAPGIASALANALNQPQLLEQIAQDNFDEAVLSASNVETLLEQAGASDADLETMSQVLQDAIGQQELTLDADALPYDLAMNELQITDDSDNKLTRVYLQFDGNLGQDSGSIAACVAYQNQLDADDELNTDGLLLQGKWQKLNDYQITLELTMNDVTRATRIKKLDQTSFAFDYDGEDGTFTTDEGILPVTQEKPLSHEDCQALLSAI